MSNTRWFKTHDGEYYSFEYASNLWIAESQDEFWVKCSFAGAKYSQSISPHFNNKEDAIRLLDRIMRDFLNKDQSLIDISGILKELRMKPV